MFRLSLLAALLLGVPVGLYARPEAMAQEIQATPLTDEAAGSFALASALTVTIPNGSVEFGQIRAGETVQIESAAVVSVSGSGSVPWHLSCSAAPTAAHTTDLPVATLEYARAGTSDWASFQADPAPCTAPTIGEATVRFNYRIEAPVSAVPGTFEVVVTYSVSAIE